VNDEAVLLLTAAMPNSNVVQMQDTAILDASPLLSISEKHGHNVLLTVPDADQTTKGLALRSTVKTTTKSHAPIANIDRHTAYD
jgi:hypothetical protein